MSKTHTIPKSLSLRYEEHGGYDCITPAYTLTDDDTGRTIATLDLKDWGITSTSTHEEVWEARRIVGEIGVRLMRGWLHYNKTLQAAHDTIGV